MIVARTRHIHRSTLEAHSIVAHRQSKEDWDPIDARTLAVSRSACRREGQRFGFARDLVFPRELAEHPVLAAARELLHEKAVEGDLYGVSLQRFVGLDLREGNDRQTVAAGLVDEAENRIGAQERPVGSEAPTLGRTAVRRQFVGSAVVANQPQLVDYGLQALGPQAVVCVETHGRLALTATPARARNSSSCRIS